jgi:restriction system protein
MQFKDAAFQIIKQAGKPLHYNEITDQALSAGLVETAGKTPHATMGALLYTDTLKPESRFRRGDEKGTFALKVSQPVGIHQQIENLKTKVHQDLLKHLRKMPARKFEELIRSLLEEMGFDEAETTPYSNDKGVDVRGVLKANPFSTVKLAIQAKRWTNNVGSSVVRELRGSLKFADAEQGLIITPSDFTPSAKSEAQAEGKIPITLVNGKELVNLLIQYQVGAKQENVTLPSIDTEYWTEVIGVSLEETPKEQSKKSAIYIHFPLQIQAKYHGDTFTAELLTLQGAVRYNGQEYPTPTTAAKIITTGWKQVNGWDFWKFKNPKSSKFEKIGNLRNS